MVATFKNTPKRGVSWDSFLYSPNNYTILKRFVKGFVMFVWEGRKQARPLVVRLLQWEAKIKMLTVRE